MRWLISLLVAISLATPSIAQTRAGVWLLTHSKRRVTSSVVVTTPDTSGLVVWYDASDTTKIKTTVAGSTSVASDGDLVGKWINKGSYSSFDVEATGDDSSRPVWHSSGGVKWVEGDGSNDLLHHFGALGFYGLSSGFTVVVGVRANPSVDAVLVTDSHSGSFPQAFVNVMMANGATASTASMRYNRSDNSQVISPSVAIQTSIFNNTDKCYAVTDSKTDIIPYVDGVAGTTYSYTRSGTVSGMDRFTLFGFSGYGGYFDFFAARLHGVLVYDRVLTGSEVLTACRYMAYLQGRSI